MKYYIILMLLVSVVFSKVNEQDNPVQAKECTAVPVIDGVADDACWADATWQAIDQVWINWGEVVFIDDFSGRYKTTWSSETDKVYFLVEIVDDVLVKGYKYPENAYYCWDVVELFFDEDDSGGNHQYNQNAFAYHITAGNDEDDFQAMDLTENGKSMNYSDHFNCKITNDGNTYIWEIALTVFNEEYDPNKSAAENTPEELYIGKQCGLSIAYCDNDDPNENPKTRDNFIGSVRVPQGNNNDHWINADWFGNLELVGAAKVETIAPQNFVLQQNYPNPFNPATTISYQLDKAGFVQLNVLDSTGRLIRKLVSKYQQAGSFSYKFNATDLASGLYICSLKTEFGIMNQKMLLIK